MSIGKMPLLCILAVVVVAGVGATVALSGHGGDKGDGGNDSTNTPDYDEPVVPNIGEFTVLVGDVIEFVGERENRLDVNYGGLGGGIYTTDFSSKYTVTNIDSEGTLYVEASDEILIKVWEMTMDDYLDLLTGYDGDLDRTESIDIMGKSVKCNVYVSTWETGTTTYYIGAEDGVKYRSESVRDGLRTVSEINEATMLDRDWTIHSDPVRKDLQIGDTYSFRISYNDYSSRPITDTYTVSDIGSDGTLTVEHNRGGYDEYLYETQEYYVERMAPGLRTDVTGEHVYIWNDGVVRCMKYIYAYEGDIVTEYVGIDSGILYWLYVDTGDYQDHTVYKFHHSSLLG